MIKNFSESLFEAKDDLDSFNKIRNGEENIHRKEEEKLSDPNTKKTNEP